MAFNRVFLTAAAAAVTALSIGSAPSKADAAPPIVLSSPTPEGYFFLTSGTLFSKSLTADLGATVTGASTLFTDEFDFTIPQDGYGSGSVSTSFSSETNELTITGVSIDGTSYTAAQAAAGVDGFPITDGMLNTIVVSGVTSSSDSAATFSGTMTFTASAAPEASIWILMVGGVGLIGALLRRRSTAVGLA